MLFIDEEHVFNYFFMLPLGLHYNILLCARW